MRRASDVHETHQRTGGPAVPLVSVIVPARDAEPTLARCLEALLAQDFAEPYEVLLVDDGSRDATRQLAGRYAPWVSVLASDTNHGPGAARNTGANVARGSILAFTDADCFPEPGWLSAGVRAIRDGADLAQGAVDAEPDVRRTPFDRTVVVQSETGFYPTANLFVRKELFESVGGFRDWLLEHERAHGRARSRPPDRRRQRAARTPIGEDTLFGWAGRRRGARTVFAGDALVHHAVVPGRLWDEILDRWHWARDMPGAARLVPELRYSCFYRRVFFSAKTAHFDLAAASLAVSLASRRTLPLLGALPYARWIALESVGFGGRDGALHALGSIVSDAATLTGLMIGSVAWRCPLI
jgi:glycosyltransferase involved in cell wall biosynthesis